jgi:putative spermidine/putrescine transport system ATP-binding protein
VLDVSLHSISNYALHDVTLTFAASSHTAIAGAPASGASTLLHLIAGTIRPKSGEIRIGARPVTNLRPAQRPLLFVTSAVDVPHRWSVRHALIAAVRRRSLDRVDRQHEYALVVDKWTLDGIIDRTIGTLSSSEQTLVHLAQIELLRPGILVADRLLERLNAAASEEVIDMFYRTLRVAGTTVISAPASRAELGVTDRVVVLEAGRVTQEGTAAQIYASPVDERSAAATGAVNVIPITIEGSSIESIIGSWEVASPPFQGTGIALVRPEAFSIAGPGAESDLIVAVEEAAFENGRWLVRAMLSGSVALRISLSASQHLHKGKLIALTYESAGFSLIQREIAVERRSVPTSIIPSMSSSR